MPLVYFMAFGCFCFFLMGGFTCSKLTIETVEQDAEYVQSQQ